MKKRGMQFIVSIILVVSLVSCGSKDIAKGTWELIKGYSGDTEITAEQLQSAGIGGVTFTFKDGKVTIKSESSSEESEGTYKLDGSNITITSDDAEGEIKGTIIDNELTIEQEQNGTSIKMVFERK